MIVQSLEKSTQLTFQMKDKWQRILKRKVRLGLSLKDPKVVSQLLMTASKESKNPTRNSNITMNANLLFFDKINSMGMTAPEFDCVGQRLCFDSKQTEGPDTKCTKASNNRLWVQVRRVRDKENT